MASKTTNYNLDMPGYDEIADIDVINGNMDKIDVQMKKNADSAQQSKDIVSDEYSATNTYAVGDYCIHENILYKCKTAITTGEAFDSNKWIQTTCGTEFGELNSNVSELKGDLVNQFDIQGWNIAPIHNFEMKLVKRDGSGIDTFPPLFNKAIHSSFIQFKSNKIRVHIEDGYNARLHVFTSNQFGTQTSYRNLTNGDTDIEVDTSKYYVFDLVHGTNIEDHNTWQTMTTNEHTNLRVFNISDKLTSLESIVDIDAENIAKKQDIEKVNTRLDDGLEVGGYSNIYVDEWKERPLSSSTGDIDNYEPSHYKAIHSGFFSVKGKTRIYLSDGYQIRLVIYSSSKVYENMKYITATGDYELDNSKLYRIILIHGKASDIVSANNITVSEHTNVKVYNITDKIKEIEKLISDSTVNKYNTRNKIYGIRIDNSTGYVTRIADSIGLSNDYVVGDRFIRNNGVNDFDNIFPWCDMKLCNIKIENGIKNITYSDEESFTLDGSNGDVMVEIPKFYTMRTFHGDIEEICISGEKKSGFVVEPAFYDSETGEEINYIYCGAYLTSVENGKHTSKTGTLPTTSKSLLEFRSFGEMYDFAMVQALQKLISIEFGVINISGHMGGLSYLIYPSDAKAYESTTNSNTGIFYSQDQGGSANIDNLFVGCNIAVGDRADLPTNRKVTELGEVTIYTDANNKKWHRRSVSFSGSAISISKDTTFIYCGANDNGLSDGMIYHTGRKGLTTTSTADQFRYRNIEGLWGNVGEMMDGVRLKNLEYYFSYKKTDYSDISKYNKLSYPSVEQNQYNFYKSFILKMGYDRRYPNVNLPCKISWDGTGNPDQYYGDILCANYLTGADGQQFPEGTEFIGISSMAWDGNNRNGMYTTRFWNTETECSYLYGTRMIYRNI